MKNKLIKTKKGGLDTIVAYIVVSLPLLYVLIYMVATIYHFSVQMYLSQVVKEATVMASTYGEITQQHEDYIHNKLKKILPSDEDDKANITIQYYKRTFITEEEKLPGEEAGTVRDPVGPTLTRPSVKKADIIGIYVESIDNSMLGNVSAFSIFGTNTEESQLKYSAYREEIIRNEKQY